MGGHDRGPVAPVRNHAPGAPRRDHGPGSGRTIRTLIAEHVHVLRLGLSAYLAQDPGIEIVAELDDGAPLAATARSLRPAVAVVDASLPPAGGSEEVARLRETVPGCAAVMLVDRADPAALSRALSAHPLGLLSNDAPAELLVHCVRRVVSGRRVIDPSLARAADSVVQNPLTPRELEVLRIAAAGATTKEIADRLSLSVKTVRNHLSRVITRTAARNRIDAIRIASEHAWL